MSKTLSHYHDIEAYVTRDGSTIRELMHPSSHSSRQQSLAEATVVAGAETRLHRHHKTEEIYYIVQGEGMMRLGEDSFKVEKGDSVCIAPGTAHNIRNTGSDELKILCCCAPAYSHQDTELL